MENNTQQSAQIQTPMPGQPVAVADAPITPTLQTAAPAAPQTPVQTPTPDSTTPPPNTTPQTPQPEQHKSKFGLLFIILFLLGVLFLGGTYLFVISQKKSTSAMPIVNKSAQIQKDVHQLEEQMPTDDTNEINKDFTQVDQEMKNL